MVKGKHTSFLLFVSVLLLRPFAHAQEPGVGFIPYAHEQGLHVAQLLRMAEDRYRNLWLLPFGGKIVRFDGVSFAEYGLSDAVFTNNIYELAISQQDTVWLLSDRGLLSFNGYEFALHAPLEGLNLGYSARLEVDKYHRLWIMDHDGRVLVKDGAIFHDMQVRGVKGLVQHQGLVELWYPTGEVLTVDRHLQITRKRLVAVHTPVSHVMIDPQNRDERILFTNQGYHRWNEATGEMTASVSAPGGTWNVADAEIDHRGHLYVMANQALHLQTSHGRWTALTEAEGFPEVKILTLFRDDAGEVWVGTDGKGLLRTQKKLLHLYQAPQRESIWKVARLADGTLLVGTFENGIYRFTGQQFLQEPGWKVLNDTKVVAIEPYGAGALIGTFGKGPLVSRFPYATDSLCGPCTASVCAVGVSDLQRRGGDLCRHQLGVGSHPRQRGAVVRKGKCTNRDGDGEVAGKAVGRIL